MLRSIVSSIEFEKFRRNWSEKNSAQRFPMGRRSGSRCIEFIIRPNFLTSNSR
ncbi:hypothetical protein [Leptospira noguchii]|uniref:hypothetical protein n=1 Tax=Leptospira noguchii TaxID=28182 RepID=UPI001FB63EB3|nr:hypothetical protein [Leptospira noguchii]UOG50982.1 hypothetical protein MAL00_20090 [Leptospira noguchii]